MFLLFSDADIRGRTEGDSTDCDIKEVRTKQNKQRKKIKQKKIKESLASGPSSYSLFKERGGEKREPIDKNSESKKNQRSIGLLL